MKYLPVQGHPYDPESWETGAILEKDLAITKKIHYEYLEPHEQGVIHYKIDASGHFKKVNYHSPTPPSFPLGSGRGSS